MVQHFHWGGGGVSSTPGQGTMIPQAVLHHQINKRCLENGILFYSHWDIFAP